MRNAVAVRHEDLLTLRELAQATPKHRQTLLRRAHGRTIKLLSECCLNFLQQTFSVRQPVLKRLKRHKQAIRSVAQRGQTVTKRRSTLVQKGGFLPLILPAAISFLTSLLGIGHR